MSTQPLTHTLRRTHSEGIWHSVGAWKASSTRFHCFFSLREGEISLLCSLFSREIWVGTACFSLYEGEILPFVEAFLSLVRVRFLSLAGENPLSEG